MRRKKTDLVFAVVRQRCFLTLLAFAVVYLLILLTFESPFFFPIAGSGAGLASLPRPLLLKTENGRLERPVAAARGGLSVVSGLMLPTPPASGASEIEKLAREAWELGAGFWGEAKSGVAAKRTTESQSEPCPSSISLSGAELDQRGKIVELPCGLTLGSHITLEWPEEEYPPYANGPGYVVSADIAHFVVSEFGKNNLRLFKKEDVSMGMWVEKFNRTISVQYVHHQKFYQCPLPVTKTGDLLVGQATIRKLPVLEHEIDSVYAIM